MMSQLADDVKSLRANRGLSQSALADAAGLSRATVAAIEGGRYQGARSQTVLALARALGVSTLGAMDVPPSPVPAEPTTARPAVHPAVAAFAQSTWFDAVRVSLAELEWLEALPHAVWDTSTPSPQALAELVAWHRRHG